MYSTSVGRILSMGWAQESSRAQQTASRNKSWKKSKSTRVFGRIKRGRSKFLLRHLHRRVQVIWPYSSSNEAFDAPESAVKMWT